ncbi:hypothetical protein [Wenyingzhuangia sp. IMCC45574]
MESNKKAAFEYFLFKILDRENILESNDYSILKVMKLLFFTAAASVQLDEEDSILDDVFSTFKALPFGHVETEVYTYLKDDFADKNIKINSSYSKIINQERIVENADIHSVDKKIDRAIDQLYLLNKDLFSMAAFDLVELSHKWYSWQHYYSIARDNGRYSQSIPLEVIKQEEHFFYL